jgi:peptide/nickel transport system substrate-binding protein
MKTSVALVLLAVAASAASPAAAPPQSRAARAAAGIAVVGLEGRDSRCLNPYLEACADPAGIYDLTKPVLRGAFVQTPSWRWVPDLVASAKATKTTLSYTIREDANWYWGGRKVPITYRDFVYTWRLLVDPKNAIAYSDRDTYVGMTGFTHVGEKQITFRWRKPLGNWKELFPYVLPATALAGGKPAAMWKTCICGNDGKPVASGPFFLESYSRGWSMLKPNPFWYGRPPGLREVVFEPLRTKAAEVRAVRDGTVDIVSPTSSFAPEFLYGAWMAKLLHVSGTVFDQVPGALAEHIEMQFGPKGNPLLSARWFRAAIAMAIDKNAVIHAAFGPLAIGVERLDSLLYSSANEHYRPDFARWRYDPEKALALLKRHCVGGPDRPGPTTAVWTCGGVAANLRFLYETTNALRTRAFTVVKDELARIGVAVGGNGIRHDDLFGPHGVPSLDYDLTEFIWGAFDPRGYAQIWSCNSAVNYQKYCNHEFTRLVTKATATLDETAATRIFRRAGEMFAADIPAIPLYDKPWALVRAADLRGVRNTGLQIFTWNIEDWRWAR